ncbi:hypothetical protein ACFLZH_02790 [Patescibacteria group bacterium]
MRDEEISFDRPEDLETAADPIEELTDSDRVKLVIKKLQTVIYEIVDIILGSDEDGAARRKQFAQISRLITEIDMHRANCRKGAFLTFELYLLEELSDSEANNVHTIINTILELYISVRGRTCAYADAINVLDSYNEKIKFFLEIFHTQLLAFLKIPDQEKLLELGTMVSSMMWGIVNKGEKTIELAKEHYDCLVLCTDFDRFFNLELFKNTSDQRDQLIKSFIKRTQDLKVRYQ